MRIVTVTVKSLTPYSSSKYVEEDLLKGETKDAHERRRWREKAHIDELGEVFIPGAGFKLALDETSAVLKEKIKGKGNSTYTKIFQTGVCAISDMPLGLRIDDLKCREFFCHANGQRAPGPRVPRIFPYVKEWGGKITFSIFNDALPEEVFERYFEQAGFLAGVGRGRPITGSPAGNGRFKPVEFIWG